MTTSIKSFDERLRQNILAALRREGGELEVRVEVDVCDRVATLTGVIGAIGSERLMRINLVATPLSNMKMIHVLKKRDHGRRNNTHGRRRHASTPLYRHGWDGIRGTDRGNSDRPPVIAARRGAPFIHRRHL